jgi:phosphatidylcholine synthase
MSAKSRAQPLSWLVHFYTASGAVLAFAATLATFDGRMRAAFLLLIASTVVDATDGMLARRAGIPHTTPRFDGARLDDIVDYLTFVFVPMLILYRAGDLPAVWGFWVVSAVLLASGYGFGSLDAKTSDYFFTGFPSYWNIVALYLHAAALSPTFNAVLLLALVVMVFVRIGYVYPSRTPVLQGLTNVLGVVWGLMMVVIVWLLPSVPGWLLIASLFFPVYYTVLSFWLHANRPRSISPK